MKKDIKLFEIRKEILNEIIPEIKEDIIQFLLKNPYNTIDFNYINNSAREKYISKKIKNTKKIISVNDLTKEKLKELFFSKEYNENFFNEIISKELLNWTFSAKANKESDFDNYYKNRYHNLIDFLDNVFEVKRLENKSYYESFQKFIGEKTLEEIFKKLEEKKCDIYYFCDDRHKKIKNANEFMEIVYKKLKIVYKKEINNIQNCLQLFYEDLKKQIKEVENFAKEKNSSNPFGYTKVTNEDLVKKIKDMKDTDFSDMLYEF